VTELQKSQYLRLWDVFFLGPFMLWYTYSKPKSFSKNLMRSLGVLTILYNGQNYLINRKLIAEGKIIPVSPTQEIET